MPTSSTSTTPRMKDLASRLGATAMTAIMMIAVTTTTTGACMRRWEFIGLISGAAAWPLAVRAQQTGIPVAGVLSPQSAGPTTASRVAGFLEGLAEAQYVAGRNVAIEYRWADGNYDRLKPLVEDLVRLNVAVIAALTQDAALAAKTHRART